jgi:hypothetical protein
VTPQSATPQLASPSPLARPLSAVVEKRTVPKLAKSMGASLPAGSAAAR